MNRFKFRAWDKVKKEMIQVDRLASDNTGEIVDIWYEPICDWAGLKDFELMQWTGLFDRNGKEIFEGDICQYYPNDPLLVVWDQKESQFRLKILSRKYSDYLRFDLDVEVIGNEHQNPELLEDTAKMEIV